MKRRKRKPRRDSKPAEQVDVPVGTRDSTTPLETQGETQEPAPPVEMSADTDPLKMQSAIEKLEASIEIQGELENLLSSLKTQEEIEKPTTPVETSADTETPAADSVAPAPAGVDRRAHPRYAFTASAEVIAGESGARRKTRVRDLSPQGCYLDTDNPLPLGTDADVRITKGATLLQAQARVVYIQPGGGMGLMFTSVEPRYHGTLDSWIAESRETSWLVANRRRSQRVLMRIPIRVSVQAGAAALSEEETYTLAVSAHGALIAVSKPLYRGQRLTLSNVQTKGALECVVAHIDRFPGEQMKVGVEFLLPNPTFWRVTFPPKDWTPRHPDAKTGAKPTNGAEAKGK
jgi:PilZ domain